LDTIGSSQVLLGNPTAATQLQGNNSTRLATTAYADSVGKGTFTTITATSTTITNILNPIQIYDVDCTSHNDTLVLPNPTTLFSFITIRKKDATTNKVVIKGYSATTINGNNYNYILFQNTSGTVYSNGTNYYTR
jgi:hypothetical protein